MKKFGLATWAHEISYFGDKDNIERHADRLKAAGFDLLIPCVKNPHGAVDFVTDVADVNPGYPDWDPLKVLIDACHERGIKVHPWFCVFPEEKNSRLLREHPEYQAEFEIQGRWACACRPEVQDYIFNLYKSLANRYRPGGLHLDYIRTGWMCKCPFCKEQMSGQGVDIEKVQQKEQAFERWKEWRVSRLTDFVRRLHDFTAKAGIELSAAVFSHYPDCVRTQAQDWVLWAEEGIIDFLFPMNYTSSTRIAEKLTLAHVALVQGRVSLWEGLDKAGFAAELNPEKLTEEAKAVLSAGAQGVVIFDYPSMTDEDIAAIKRLRCS